MEIWKTVTDFENYEVSNLGNVRRKNCVITYSNGLIYKYKQKYLNQELTKRGKTSEYRRVTLSKNGIVKRFQVHRLVAVMFIDNIENKPCVNHIDGDGLNNKVSNLEWCTYSENERHSYDVLNKINPIRKLTEDQVRFIKLKGVMGRNGNTRELSIKFNVSIYTIQNILKNRYYVKVA